MARPQKNVERVNEPLEMYAAGRGWGEAMQGARGGKENVAINPEAAVLRESLIFVYRSIMRFSPPSDAVGSTSMAYGHSSDVT